MPAQLADSTRPAKRRPPRQGLIFSTRARFPLSWLMSCIPPDGQSINLPSFGLPTDFHTDACPALPCPGLSLSHSVTPSSLHPSVSAIWRIETLAKCRLDRVVCLWRAPPRLPWAPRLLLVGACRFPVSKSRPTNQPVRARGRAVGQPPSEVGSPAPRVCSPAHHSHFSTKPLLHNQGLGTLGGAARKKKRGNAISATASQHVTSGGRTYKSSQLLTPLEPGRSKRHEKSQDETEVFLNTTCLNLPFYHLEPNPLKPEREKEKRNQRIHSPAQETSNPSFQSPGPVTLRRVQSPPLFPLCFFSQVFFFVLALLPSSIKSTTNQENTSTMVPFVCRKGPKKRQACMGRRCYQMSKCRRPDSILKPHGGA